MARIASGELESFSDVHKVIEPCPTPGEYRYGEEFEGEFPKKGEHWVSAADELVVKQGKADLDRLSSEIDASPISNAMIAQEATRIFNKLKELERGKAAMMAAGLDVCRFTVERRITDLERNKKVLETDAGKDIQAVLSAKLRVDGLSQYNTRDAARKLYAEKK